MVIDIIKSLSPLSFWPFCLVSNMLTYKRGNGCSMVDGVMVSFLLQSMELSFVKVLGKENLEKL